MEIADLSSQVPGGAEAYRRAYNKCIEWLSRREHSRLELIQKLMLFAHNSNTEELPAAEVDSLLNFLEARGYQSDARYAEVYTRSRLRKGFGGQRVALELAQRGISTAMAEQAIAVNSDEEFDSERLIYNTWSKKFHLPPIDLKERAKQQRFLQYRGFSGQEISRLFNKLEGEHT